MTQIEVEQPWHGMIYDENGPPPQVRAGLQDEILDTINEPGGYGLTIKELSEDIARRVHEERQAIGREAPYKTDDVRVEMLVMAGVSIKITSESQVYPLD